MKYRAQRLKSRWEEYSKRYEDGTPTVYGRMSLTEFVRHNYVKYCELCYFCKEKPLTITEWVMVK